MEQLKQQVYQQLCEKFGADQIVTNIQISADTEPFDFYIIPKDCYIDCFQGREHGHDWYDEDSSELPEVDDETAAELSDWWMMADVQKRYAVWDNGLNYVVFWDPKGRDITIWFAMDCPIGCDADDKYSWLPQRSASDMCYSRNLKFTGTPANCSMLVKKYQFRAFYKRELELWKQNWDVDGIPLHLYLYHNRLKYLKKLPDELTDVEILRGMSICGICRNYTVFDITMMQQVLEKYPIRSVLDPCAGWGERLLCCFAAGLPYQGIDVNRDLKDGYRALSEALSITDQKVLRADAAGVRLYDIYDAVITCPPYGDTEIYTSYGAENLDRDEFLDWWRQVVENCADTGILYFCFQVNQAWKQAMTEVVTNYGFKLVEEIADPSKNKVCHFNRRNGKVQKREYESMMILKRV